MQALAGRQMALQYRNQKILSVESEVFSRMRKDNQKDWQEDGIMEFVYNEQFRYFSFTSKSVTAHSPFVDDEMTLPSGPDDLVMFK